VVAPNQATRHHAASTAFPAYNSTDGRSHSERAPPHVRFSDSRSGPFRRIRSTMSRGGRAYLSPVPLRSRGTT